MITDALRVSRRNEVFLGGERIGSVERHETRYNLRRVIVHRCWRARDPDRQLVRSSVTDCGGYPTRADAVTAILRGYTDAKEEK